MLFRIWKETVVVILKCYISMILSQNITGIISHWQKFTDRPGKASHTCTHTKWYDILPTWVCVTVESLHQVKNIPLCPVCTCCKLWLDHKQAFMYNFMLLVHFKMSLFHISLSCLWSDLSSSDALTQQKCWWWWWWQYDIKYLCRVQLMLFIIFIPWSGFILRFKWKRGVTWSSDQSKTLLLFQDYLKILHLHFFYIFLLSFFPHECLRLYLFFSE